ncbi:response regulator [Intestinibacillus sp. Marseille-P6563]|uniref:response regulator n=1 Tax=Intestinibacillus sp. Marseille-P6563 TaxID=2364792 RepID=UPI000F04CD49|nr:response regulator [Intestinibacillus sp. Marseille-P6563]
MTRDTLLIIDDSELDLAILNEIFKGLFHVECFQEATQALSFIHKESDRICAALVDICLGRRGAGFTLLHRLQTNPLTTKLPIILITSDANRDYVLHGLEQGAADFLVKPVDPHTVQKRVCDIIRGAWPQGETILDHQQDRSALTSTSQTTNTDDFCLLDRLPESLSAEQAAQLADDWQQKFSVLCQLRPDVHAIPSRRIPRLTGLLADAWRSLHDDNSLTELQAAYTQQAARLCDLGKLGLPDSTASAGAEQPEPGRTAYMRHTEFGRALWQSNKPHPFLSICADVAYWHHKNFDGTGYPATPEPVEVPLWAQLVHAAFRCDLYLCKYADNPDCYDRALRALSSEAGTILSPEMFRTIEAAREPMENLLTKV